MSRQINLLVQRVSGPEFSAERALAGFGVILVACLLYGTYAWFATRSLDISVDQTESRLAAERAALTALEQKLGERPKPAEVEAQIAAHKVLAAESREILNLVGAGSGTQPPAHLAALATVSEDGVWLTGIKVGGAGTSVQLAGRSMRNESVLRYAQRLNTAFAARGVQFTSVELSPPETLKVIEGDKEAAVSFVAFKLF